MAVFSGRIHRKNKTKNRSDRNWSFNWTIWSTRSKVYSFLSFASGQLFFFFYYRFFFLLFSKVMAPNCAELLSKRQAVDGYIYFFKRYLPFLPPPLLSIWPVCAHYQSIDLYTVVKLYLVGSRAINFGLPFFCFLFKHGYSHIMVKLD